MKQLGGLSMREYETVGRVERVKRCRRSSQKAQKKREGKKPGKVGGRAGGGGRSGREQELETGGVAELCESWYEVEMRSERLQCGVVQPRGGGGALLHTELPTQAALFCPRFNCISLSCAIMDHSWPCERRA